MKPTTKKSTAKLNAAIAPAIRNFKPPEDLTVAEWADRHRRLSPENSAESGPWRTSRTPYLREPMEAFTDPKIRKIVMVAASQVGKSELELNIIGYIIDQDPGSILFVQPSLDDARKFSRLRIAPMIRDSKVLRAKVSDVKSKDSGNTILQKSFPGGMLTITGSNSASALASTPARYILGDERDRWAVSAGAEGDPWALAEARQATFYNAKAVEVSTPTIKGASNIESSYYLGTQERWCHQCPECGEYGEITFDRVHFEHTVAKVRGKKAYKIVGPITWCCPSCGCIVPEEKMRKQPAKWIAENPAAYDEGVRSFWLNAFSSPWTPWEKIALKFLQAKDDPQKLKVVYNTLLGELWEDRGDIADEDTMLARREDYGTNADGSPVEVPEGVLVLTCGVDTQDNRLEYEVVGHGFYGETWFTGREALEKGFADAIKEDEDDPEMSMSADRKVLFVNGVRHNVDGLQHVPGTIPVKAIATPPAAKPGANKKKPTTKAAKKEGGNKPMDEKELRATYPEIVAQIEASARTEAQNASGEAVAAERQRIEQIDSIAASIPDQQLVHDAKYGDNPCTAQELCFRVMQASAASGQNFLAAYQAEGAKSGAADVGAAPNGGTPASAQEQDAADIQAVVSAYNQTKGGMK